MKPEIKKRWLAALRSGKYRKGLGALRRDKSVTGGVGDEFCCLGVLCDLAVRDGVISKPNAEGNCYTYGPDMRAAYLPNKVVEWAGLSRNDPSVRTDKGAPMSLAQLNDDSMTFDPVINAIERSL